VFVAALRVLAGASIVNAVANNEATATPLNVGTLARTDPEPLWLEAQSVPSASLVPCLRSLPIGWTLEKATVNDGRSVRTLNHDRAGTSAAVVRLTATCSPVGAAQVPSDQPGARRYLRIERLTPEFSATRFDVFAGGCVTTRLNVPAAHRAQLTSDATSLLGFATRQALQQTLEQRSNGRLQLDPPHRP
jgi:hypothetical protein